MDVLDLVVLKPEDSLKTALDAMRDSHRSAILIDYAEQYVIAFISSITKAKLRGVLKLNTIRDTFPAPLMSDETAARHSLNWFAPKDSSDSWTHYLRTRQLPYTVTRRLGNRASVVTRHERLARMLTNTYYCDVSSDHIFPYPKVTEGEVCPECLGHPKGTIHSQP